MRKAARGDRIARYFILVVSVSVFVMLYVWQNIEIVRIELECRDLARTERNLREEHNRLRAALETLSARDVVGRVAAERGYGEVTPGQIDTIRFEDSLK